MRVVVCWEFELVEQLGGSGGMCLDLITTLNIRQ